MSDNENPNRRVLQRIAAADFILSELEKGHFPHLSKFLNNARFNIRQITKPEAFVEQDEQPDFEKLRDGSRLSGTVHVSMQPAPRVSLFYEKDLTEAEASLFSHSLQKIGALAFAALGLDMSGLVTVEEGLLRESQTDKDK